MEKMVDDFGALNRNRKTSLCSHKAGLMLRRGLSAHALRMSLIGWTTALPLYPVKHSFAGVGGHAAGVHFEARFENSTSLEVQ